MVIQFLTAKSSYLLLQIETVQAGLRMVNQAVDSKYLVTVMKFGFQKNRGIRQ